MDPAAPTQHGDPGTSPAAPGPAAPSVGAPALGGVPAGAVGGRPVVLFDGVCNLCNGAVQVILDHDRRGDLLLAASQSPAGERLLAAAGASAAASDTIVLVEDGRVHARSTAVLRIARRMGFPFALLAVFLVVPRPLRDLVYDFIARNRYRWFGRRDACRLPRPGELDRFLSE